MYIKELSLYNFRNYSESDVTFESSTNIICGENAAGKTNLLEAIFLFAAGKSFRSIKEKGFIKFEQEMAAVSLVFEDNVSEKRMEIRFSGRQKRKIYREGIPVTKMSEFLGLFRAVVFTPDHLGLVKGAPELRRRFLDMAICQSYPRYAATLSEYNRVLLQKNALLRSPSKSEEMLDIYNEKLCRAGAVITHRRRRYVAELEKYASIYHEEITSGKEKLTLKFISQSESNADTEGIEESYKKLFESKKEMEMQKGITMCGSHKDDFTSYINTKNARIYGSQGQQRTAVLALKLAEGEISLAETGEYPVFLLDDILSELDIGRREYIISKLGGKQVLITGCEKELFDMESHDRAKVISVENGRIKI